MGVARLVGGWWEGGGHCAGWLRPLETWCAQHPSARALLQGGHGARKGLAWPPTTQGSVAAVHDQSLLVRLSGKGESGWAGRGKGPDSTNHCRPRQTDLNFGGLLCCMWVRQPPPCCASAPSGFLCHHLQAHQPPGEKAAPALPGPEPFVPRQRVGDADPAGSSHLWLSYFCFG